MSFLTFFRDLDRELILMKGHQQYMHDKLALLEVRTNCSVRFICIVQCYFSGHESIKLVHYLLTMETVPLLL